MVCCCNCFSSEEIKEKIQKENKIGNCDYCNTKNVNIIDINKLKPSFERIRKFYNCKTMVLGMLPQDEYEDAYTGSFIPQLQEWKTFNMRKLKKEGICRLYYDIVGMDIEDKYYIETGDYSPATRETYNKSIWEDYLFELQEWDIFSKYIKHNRRFFLDDIIAKMFRDECLDPKLIEGYRNTIKKNTIIYRARINESGIKTAYEKRKMTEPPREKASEGRANPAGISYLYAAEDDSTAISEVRAWVGQFVSIGKIRVLKELNVIDFTQKDSIPSPIEYALRNKMPEYRRKMSEFFIWEGMRDNISRPYDSNQSPIEYVATQFLTEFIAHNGYDGIMFKSSVNRGINYVIFNKKAYNVEEVYVKQIEKINITSKLVQ